MKKLLFLLLFISIYNCTSKSSNPIKEDIPVVDNPEIKEIYDNDQNDRTPDKIDWPVVNKRDSLRRVRVHQLLDSGKVITGKDFARAAMVFQHGQDSTDYGLAVSLMKTAIEKDTTIDKWLFAAATDRYLLSKGEPQIYGTQYFKNRAGGPWYRQEIDTTKISDEERKAFGVRTLAEQLLLVEELNSEENGN
ncbi:MAG: DUF6624 domain-containing protein [bacterium]